MEIRNVEVIRLIEHISDSLESLAISDKGFISALGIPECVEEGLRYPQGCKLHRYTLRSKEYPRIIVWLDISSNGPSIVDQYPVNYAARFQSISIISDGIVYDAFTANLPIEVSDGLGKIVRHYFG